MSSAPSAREGRRSDGRPGTVPFAQRATVIYDGTCGFCRRWIDRARRLDRHGRITFIPYQTPDFAARFPEIPRDEYTRRIHLIDADGTVHRGAAAGREVVRRLSGGWLWALPFRLPGGLRVAEQVYTWITHRWGPVAREPTRATGRWRRLVHRVRRTTGAARLSSRAATRWVASRVREARSDEAERERLRAAFHLRTAEDVTATMGAMKGAMMKLAQMVSYVDSGLPEPYRQTLAQLQADAPPMTSELAAEVVREELGRPPADVFAWFDPEPLAAASIGQVHAARTRDGDDVVVKVQYPGVADAMQADLDNVDLLYRLMSMVFPRLDPKPFVAELRARLGEELDYRVELRNQRRFLELYRGHPFIRIPEVVPALSTRRVLTMERMEGLTWRDAVAAPPDIRNVWAEVIYRYVFGTFYRARLFNGDPHPGNYRFRADGSVAFLDYGCLKEFTPGGLADVRRIVFASIAGDAAGLRGELVRQKFLAPDDDADPARLVTWLRIAYRPILEREPFTITREWAELLVRSSVDPSSEWADVQRRFNIPADYVLINRISLGLMSVLAGLEATNSWRAICEEFWHDAPPATELGRQDAAFRARRPPRVTAI